MKNTYVSWDWVVAEGEQQAYLVADKAAAEPEHHGVDPAPRGVVGGYAHPAGNHHHGEAVPEVVEVYPSAHDHGVRIHRREDSGGEECDGE